MQLFSSKWTKSLRHFFKIIKEDRGDLYVFITSDGLLLRRTLLLCSVANFQGKKNMMLSLSISPCCIKSLMCLLSNTTLSNKLALSFVKTHKKVLSANKIITRHHDFSYKGTFLSSGAWFFRNHGMCLPSICNTQDPRFLQPPHQNFWLWCVYVVAWDEAAVLLEVIFLPLRCLKENVICIKGDLFSRLSVLSLGSWPKKKVCVWCPGEG